MAGAGLSPGPGQPGRLCKLAGTEKTVLPPPGTQRLWLLLRTRGRVWLVPGSATYRARWGGWQGTWWRRLPGSRWRGAGS